MNFGTEGAYSRPGVSISRYENEEIGWETAYKTNLGIELSRVCLLNPNQAHNFICGPSG